MYEATVKIINERGMHARTASQFINTLKEKSAENITVLKDGKEVDGFSILGLLTLSASKNTFITIRTSGRNAEDTLSALVKLIENGFSE